MKTKSKTLVVLFLVLLILTGFIGIYPGFYEYQCRNRTYSDMESGLNSVFTANISVITVTYHDGMTGYSTGASGVIFDRTKQRYYALTAYHVVADQNTYRILTTNSDSLEEYRKKHPERGHIPIMDYYDHLPEAKIEYMYEEADLAVISFECGEELSVIPISGDMPSKGDRIAAVGTLDGKPFETTYGKVTSRKLSVFNPHDGQMENRVLRHNAYEMPGSSGGAVFDDKMNLAGINIGGGMDIFKRFRYGAMIPCDQIQQCINNWKK